MDIGEVAASFRAGEFDAVAHRWVESYEELRRIARGQLRVRLRNATLLTTDLLHEAFLKLERSPAALDDRAEFLAVCSTVMRCLVIDELRRRGAVRHGGGLQQTTLTSAIGGQREVVRVDVFDLEAALARLVEHSPGLVHLIEMKFYGGMTNAEIAEALDVSASTVKRDWAKARSLLRSLLESGSRTQLDSVRSSGADPVS